MSTDADVIVVGGGLAGLVATAELVNAGRRVILLDQEPEASLGGQAFWSLGGLFLVDTPEQRRMRIHDCTELALQDWLGSAGFDRPEDEWPRKWAQAYVEFAAGEKRQWLYDQGVRFVPSPGWPERGGYLATEHGNSVPRFHIAWGAGPGVVEPFERRVREGVARGLVTLKFRHRVDSISSNGGALAGVAGTVLEPSSVVARAAELADAGGRVRAGRAGGDRDLRRYRRQPRARALVLAGDAGPRSGTHAVGRPRLCRRPDAEDQR